MAAVKPMYQMKPIYQTDAVKDLPSCMYKMKSFYEDNAESETCDSVVQVRLY